jgi:hypothetical protein
MIKRFDEYMSKTFRLWMGYFSLFSILPRSNTLKLLHCSSVLAEFSKEHEIQFFGNHHVINAFVNKLNRFFQREIF